MKNTPIYGLVLSGGKSSRMKTDKASLKIHGQSQLMYAYELLSEICTQTFISMRNGQVPTPEQKVLPTIYDLPEVSGHGPIAGIVSALKNHPHVSWIVLACDLPFVNSEVLEKLVRERNPHKKATAYKSTHDGLPEPLCAIFESSVLSSLLEYVAQGKNCPRKFLINSDVHLLEQPFKEALDNVNTPEELNEAVKKLSQMKVRE